MAGFTKLSSDIVDSSIWDESPETCKVWITLLALADPEGYVRGSEGWLAGKSRVSMGKCVLALNTFQQPDIRSRNPKNGGKRIEKTENGWKILNYPDFRENWEYSQKPSAVRMRQFRERHGASQSDNVRHLYASASDSDTIGKGFGGNLPTKEMALGWLADWRKNGATYTQQETESAFLALSANGWMWGKNPVVDFRAALERQIQTDRNNKKTVSGPNSSQEKERQRQYDRQRYGLKP